MSLPGPSATQRAGRWGQARASFDWIELLAVPLALSVMETQAIAVGLAFLALAFLQDSSAVSLDTASITLLLLGLHWWAKAVSFFTQGRSSITRARLLQLPSLLLAIALTVVTHLSLLNNISALFFSILLIIGFWFIGMYRVQTGPDDQYVLTSFKVGLGMLLGILILTLLNFDLVLRDQLTYVLPTFFLSGLIALSFTRIMLIRKENAAQRGSQADLTRGWLLVLTLAWIIVIVSAITFEAFGFQPLAVAALFLWNGLGTVINWLLLLLSPLFNFTAQFFIPIVLPQKPSLPQPIPSRGHPPSLPYLAEILLIARLLLLIILLGMLFFVIRAILRRWHAAPDDESEEEIRESLSKEAILKTRQQQRQRSKSGDLGRLEPLDPNSVRAHYRELLQELAWHGENLARQADETPSEYERRLLALLKKTSSETQEDGTPTDPALLDELTAAYMQERYGSKPTRLEHEADVQGWIPLFVKRLVNR